MIDKKIALGVSGYQTDTTQLQIKLEDREVLNTAITKCKTLIVQYIFPSSNFDQALNEFQPDLVVYNAGTDVLDGDPLGNLRITEQVGGQVHKRINETF